MENTYRIYRYEVWFDSILDTLPPGTLNEAAPSIVIEVSYTDQEGALALAGTIAKAAELAGEEIFTYGKSDTVQEGPMFTEETYKEAASVVECVMGVGPGAGWEDGVFWPPHRMAEADIAFSIQGKEVSVTLWEMVNDGTERSLCQTGRNELFTTITLN